MSQALAARAEIFKLARLLRVEPAELDYLEHVPAADIRQLREQVTDMLFEAHGPALGRLAAGSKLLPVPVIVLIAERALGPVLAARVAGMIETSRAVEVAAKLPIHFLADVAVDIDPRRATDVIGRIPPHQIAEVTAELIRRQEYVTMGRFVGHLRDDAIVAAVGQMDDPTLLQVAFVLEEKEILDHVVELLADSRLEGIVNAAADGNLWAEVLDLLGHLSEDRRAQLAEQAAVGVRLDDGSLEALANAVVEHDMWTQVAEIVERLPEDELGRISARIAELVARLDPAAREVVVAQAHAAGVLDRLGPLREALMESA